MLEQFARHFSTTKEGSALVQVCTVVFVIAVAAKFLLFAFLVTHGGQEALFFGESKRYLALGQSVAAGDGYYYKENLESFRPPGYPLYFAFFQYFKISFYVASLLQILVAACIPVLVSYAAIRFLGLSTGAALGAGILAAVEPVQTFYGLVFLPDTYFAIFFLIGCISVTRWLTYYSIHDAVIAGMAFGIANYVRPAGLYLLLFLFVGIAVFLLRKNGVTKKRVVHCAIMFLFSVLVLLPWHVRNYEAFGRFSFVSMTAHLAYVYSAIAAEAASLNTSYEAQYPRLMQQARHEAPNPGYIQGFANESYLKGRALEIISAHPKEFFTNYVWGLNTFWFSGNYHYLLARYGFISFPKSQVSFSMIAAGGGVSALLAAMGSLLGSGYLFFAIAGKVFWVVVVAGALFGAYLMREKPLAVVFLTCVVYASATLLLTTYGVEARHRYMINPLLFLFFVATLQFLYEAYLRRRTGYERGGGGVRVSA